MFVFVCGGGVRWVREDIALEDELRFQTSSLQGMDQ